MFSGATHVELWNQKMKIIKFPGIENIVTLNDIVQSIQDT